MSPKPKWEVLNSVSVVISDGPVDKLGRKIKRRDGSADDVAAAYGETATPAERSARWPFYRGLALRRSKYCSVAASCTLLRPHFEQQRPMLRYSLVIARPEQEVEMKGLRFSRCRSSGFCGNRRWDRRRLTCSASTAALANGGRARSSARIGLWCAPSAVAATMRQWVPGYGHWQPNAGAIPAWACCSGAGG
jgi:hypothetical protein